MGKKLIGEDFITQAYLRRYGMTKRAKKWRTRLVCIETDRGVWHKNARGYTLYGNIDAWVLSFGEATAHTAHCGPEKKVRFLFVREERGIYVAFDGDGRHFAYARHPDDIAEMEGMADPEGERRNQKREIDSYRRQAKAKGGKLELLSLDEYRRRVIGFPEGRSA